MATRRSRKQAHRQPGAWQMDAGAGYNVHLMILRGGGQADGLNSTILYQRWINNNGTVGGIMMHARERGGERAAQRQQ